MRLSRKAFFDAIRVGIHTGSLTADQVASYEAILDAAAAFPVTDPRHLAYILATARGEAGSAMRSVREFGRGRGKAYGTPDPATGNAYYGRGFVQLTWAVNYRNLGKRLGLPLYEQPDLALDPVVAAKIIVTGMMEGIFTGKRLEDFINGKAADYRNARRIINGMDRADEFADFARRYEAAIRQAVEGEVRGEVREASGSLKNTKPGPAPDQASPPAPQSAPAVTQRVSREQWIIGVIAAAIAALFAWVFSGGQP